MAQKPQLDPVSTRIIYRFGWLTLSLIMILTAYGVGMALADTGAEPRSQGITSPSILQIAVLLILPVVLLAAWCWHKQHERIAALRESNLGPWLPLLLTGSVVAPLLIVSLFAGMWEAATGTSVQRSDLGLDIQSWLFFASVAAVLVFWSPFFPRLIATLVGMAAGAGLFLLLGLVFFESFLTEPRIPEEYKSLGFDLSVLSGVSGAATLLGLTLLSRDKWSVIWLLLGLGICALPWLTWPLLILSMPAFVLGLLALVLTDRIRLRAHPLACAAVSALLAAGLSAFGAAIGSAWTVST